MLLMLQLLVSLVSTWQGWSGALSVLITHYKSPHPVFPFQYRWPTFTPCVSIETWQQWNLYNTRNHQHSTETCYQDRKKSLLPLHIIPHQDFNLSASVYASSFLEFLFLYSAVEVLFEWTGFLYSRNWFLSVFLPVSHMMVTVSSVPHSI